jgi:hypothetical protein
MITIEIMGGLGNQLFQVFALISYALSEKQPFFFENKDTDRADRPRYWTNFLKSLRPFVKDLDERLLLYREPSFEYKKIPPYESINTSIKLFGYYQSYKYFEEKEQEIYRLIKLDEQRAAVKEKYKDYNYEKTISVHFRIGDYKNLQHCHPLVGVEYYVKSISKIIENTGKKDWNILYFYEEVDKELVMNNIIKIKNELGSLTFKKIDTQIVDYEQVLIMSLCKHQVIANSSFSWWGAYLNKNEEKIVCYPNPDGWFGPGIGKKNMTTMFPESWCKVI